MQKSDVRILIIEDDPSLGKAVEEGLKRSGYSAQLVYDYKSAQNAIKISDFQGMVVDCMLPGKSGVDIAAELIADSIHDVVVILTSGIFKDRAFAVEAQLKTKARAFLHKPFDIQSLINQFDDAFKDSVEADHDPIHQLLAREQYSARDKINAINNTDFIHGFDLPLIYSLLLDPQIVGQLHIQYDDGLESIIGFYRGQIDKVRHHDTESYFGVLLVEKGFTTPEELQESLNLKVKKPIGQRLVDNSSLSPHAVGIVQHEQMVIRISKTIQDTSVKIEFAEETRPEPEIVIDGFLFTQLLSDWICSKISSSWLRSFYTPWLENPVVLGPDSSKLSLLRGLPAAHEFADLIALKNWPHSLQELLSQNPMNEEELLRGVHFFLVQRVFYFGAKVLSPQNFDIKMGRLEKIFSSMQNQNHFEVLGVSTNARSTEIHRAYHELAKTLHPDKLHPNSPQDLKELTQQIFSRISEAYQILSNEEKRKHYVKTLDMGLAEEVLKAEANFEEGQRHLRANRFRDARKTFERTMKMKGHRTDTVVYMIWSLIKEKRHRSDHKSLLEKVSSMLHQVAHEDRHSPHYFFIKGMYFELTGQVQKAYKHFKHSITIDPSFNDAKREILFIKQHYAQQKSFTDDLSVVVTKLFKKKSG